MSYQIEVISVEYIEMMLFKIFLSVSIALGNTFFKSISSFPVEKKTKILERRIDFICSRGINLQLAETTKEYLKIKGELDQKSLKIFEKCLKSSEKTVVTQFLSAIYVSDEKYFWELFNQINAISSRPSREMFRNFLIENVNAENAHYFYKHKEAIFDIFSEEINKGNRVDLLFKKSIFWGFNSLVEKILSSESFEFKNEEGNLFWMCVFLKNRGKFQEALDCFSRSKMGLSKMFYQLTIYAKTKQPISYSVVEKEVDKIRKSKNPIKIKLVNEVILAIITEKKDDLKKAIFSEYLSKEKRSEWYDFIVLIMDKKFNLLSVDQKKSLFVGLEGSKSGLYFLDILRGKKSYKNLSIFPKYSYQALLLGEQRVQ